MPQLKATKPPGLGPAADAYFDGVACGNWLVCPLNVKGPCWLQAGAPMALVGFSGLLATGE